jgi:hypothetical protein
MLLAAGVIFLFLPIEVLSSEVVLGSLFAHSTFFSSFRLSYDDASPHFRLRAVPHLRR